MLACTHPRQSERLQALYSYDILDTPKEEEFDDIVDLVSRITEAPVAVINFIDADRQWFKAEVGLGVRSTPLETSMCSHIILDKDFVEIPDTLADPRMCDNPLCTGDNGFRFYAGALLKTSDGLPIGTLCVLDSKPRTLTDLQRHTIKVMAQRVMRELELRLALKRQHVLRREVDHRVKNSLASVAAIITLQASRSELETTRDALNAVLTRLGALESLHEELHQDGAGATVDVARLLERSVDKLRQLLPPAIAIEVDIAPFEVTSAEANAIALTINEFVTNSAKHGMANGAAGTIRIEGRAEGEGFRIVCHDDGSGDTDSITRIHGSTGLGTRVIRALAASIGARIRWSAASPGIRLELIVATVDETSSPAASH
jgi:two-component sensor histidine kinase